jgi:O-antigen ligase/Tfp pilus assembly protein PilF
MSDQETNSISWKPGRLFYIGLGLVLLANWLPFIPAWYTFVHMWRVEIAASIFLACTFIYLLVNLDKLKVDLRISREEFRFIIVPLLAFILWSFLSAIWAPFWKSAIHHSLIWTEYLAFYLLFRYADSRLKIEKKILTLFVAILVFYAVPAIVEFCAFLALGGSSTTIGMRFAKYGEQVVTIFPLVLVFLVRLRGRRFAIGATAASILWLLIFCSLGRINYILFAAALAFVSVALIISKQHRRYIPKLALLVLLFILSPIPLQTFTLLSPTAPVSAVARFTDSDRLSESNNFRKLMMSVAGEMIRENPMIGIGADNFGFAVNRYRAKYGSAHADDVNLAAAEDQNPEHAHNEFLQIVAELGAVGAVIFAWMLTGIALMAFRSLMRIRSGSLVGFAAVTGLGMFLASSLVSAYSFRVMQNGILFFFVLAIAVRSTLADGETESTRQPLAITPLKMRTAIAAGLLACVGLTIYSGLRVASVIVSSRAVGTRTMGAALPLYELSMRLDTQNPDVRQNLGMRFFRNKLYADAVPFLESAVSIGKATSADLSYLATARSLAGDREGAERTLSMAAALYPRSPFVLTRYATLLEKNGKTSEADTIFDRASSINGRSARTWQALINSGPKALSEMAARAPASYLPVMELKPQNAIYAVVTERLILHPDEQRFSFAKLSEEEE